MAANNHDYIRDALESVAESAHALAIHGANGYDVASSALDVGFLRSLYKLSTFLAENNDGTAVKYDPEGDLYAELPRSNFY